MVSPGSWFIPIPTRPLSLNPQGSWEVDQEAFGGFGFALNGLSFMSQGNKYILHTETGLFDNLTQVSHLAR